MHLFIGLRHQIIIKNRYNLKQDLIDKNQIKDQQNRRLFSPQTSQGNALIGDGRLSNFSHDLEPFSEKVNYLETAEYVKTQHNFFNQVRKIEKQKEIHYKNFLSMNRLPQRNIYIKEAYSTIKLNNIYDEYMPSYKRLSLFTPQMSASAASSQILNQKSAKSSLLKREFKTEVKDIHSPSNQSNHIRQKSDQEIQRSPHSLQSFNKVLKETSNLLEKEQNKIKNSIKNQQNDQLMTGLNKKRIINITLDSDLDIQNPKTPSISQ